MTEQTLNFQAEVAKLLDIVTHSLYSHKEIFLRELVSNASDACDRLRYSALTQPELVSGAGDLKILIRPDKKAKTLTIEDNGIGMSRADLVENLGTIARSGTANFLAQLSGDAKKDVALIGQFGVGFYSAFMVADDVEVFTRKAGETQGWHWRSDGKGSYSVGEAADAPRGARIVLHLKEGEEEFLEEFRLKRIVKTYSDHIAIPIRLALEGKEEETVNSASALWTRAKSDVTAEQYKEFYHHVAHAFDTPWLTVHYKAEGAIEYASLLFIPTEKPIDLFTPDRKQHVKLYVRRVFITDDCEDLLPAYLRFVKGVVDSQDLPLNISREMLQKNPVLAKIKSGLVKRILSELKKKAEEAPEDYLGFWANFGAVLKEGIYEDRTHKDEIAELARFHCTGAEKPISLADYLGRMKEGQDAIYYISGDDLESVRKSPQLEGFAAKGIPVLLLVDPIDEFWVPSFGIYKDKPLKSVAEAGEALDKIKGEAEAEPPKADPSTEREIADLIATMKKILGSKVKDVRKSARLTESAVCLISDAGDMSIHLEKLLRQHRQIEQGVPRVLEINPRHGLIKRLAALAARNAESPELADSAFLLLDQARLMEGEAIEDPVAFARRLAQAMERGLN